MSDLRLENMDFEKMDFKELRSAVKQCFKENILLRDELAIMKRKYEDLLYNLDYENFSSSVISDGKNMQTSIKQTAESVKIAAEKADEAKAKTAELEVTAERISSTVTKVEKNVSNLSSEIGQTADNIRMVVAATYSNPVEVDKFVRTGADKEVIYYEKETDLYWYYNGAEWVETTNANFGTVFEQTATGFKLKGNVEISGDLITEGSIKGIDIIGTKFWDSNENAYICVKPMTGTGDFQFCNSSNDVLFEVYDEITAIGLKTRDYNFLRASYTNNKTYAYGTWNFEGCEIEGLGSTVAVFA